MAAGGDDCDDADPAVHPDATDVPYDAIDQDCSGADLTDVDGDGYDGVVDGAADCDDADPAIHPGAVETANDGVDQDCDGADLVVTDVDGDGHDAAWAGGDDCDDATSTTFPGAAEDEANGVDDDCDGLIDERLVCWDGSGDFLTIKEGLDATPDGGVVEICPGTYAEYLSLIDRDLTVQGGGEVPDDVVIEAGDGGAFYLEGDGLDLTVRNVALHGGDSNPGIIACVGTHSVNFDLIDFSSDTRETLVYVDDYGGDGWGSVVISRSSFRGSYSIYANIYNEFEFRDNMVTLPAGSEFVLFFQTGEFGTTEIHNNLFVGGAVGLYVHGLGWGQVFNNTFAYGEAATILVGAEVGAWEFWNNVVDDMSDPDGYLLDLSYNIGGSDLPYPPDCSRRAPGTGSPNLLWLDQNIAGRCTVSNAEGESGAQDNLDTMVASMFSTADPMFVSGAGMGEYAFDPASPAVDAGIGDPDADGSPPDLGAFGGPDSDWWKEVPWLD